MKALIVSADHFEDSELVTSRQPADLPAFMREMVRLLGKTSP